MGRDAGDAVSKVEWVPLARNKPMGRQWRRVRALHSTLPRSQQRWSKMIPFTDPGGGRDILVMIPGSHGTSSSEHPQSKSVRNWRAEEEIGLGVWWVGGSVVEYSHVRSSDGGREAGTSIVTD